MYDYDYYIQPQLGDFSESSSLDPSPPLDQKPQDMSHVPREWVAENGGSVAPPRKFTGVILWYMLVIYLQLFSNYFQSIFECDILVATNYFQFTDNWRILEKFR